ncbi:hypothetical protein ES677_06470 [Bizionia gelidisalsuginis]|uniref:Uncharacterized protein n=2 Tax=Bizionia TaxID=283785 RepID=A0A8H2LN66_9FLAO|nr:MULTISPECIES: hypothetical protein [Bizionia]TYB76624.1 hypothetical protein ES676_04580 [Bizionia saleffrena]TYC14183.1 hypothetical protein ES677_06470 [Bizionia gelidisalsuginis]
MITPNNWSKKELLAYILLYIANIDLEESSNEREFILNKIDVQTFKNIHKEFEADNDYQCIQKILKSIKSHDYFRADYRDLFVDIKLMIFADGDEHSIETTIFNTLKKIIKAE